MAIWIKLSNSLYTFLCSIWPISQPELIGHECIIIPTRPIRSCHLWAGIVSQTLQLKIYNSRTGIVAKHNSHIQREINETDTQKWEINLREMKKVVVRFIFYSFLKPNILPVLGFHETISMCIYNNFFFTEVVLMAFFHLQPKQP